MANEKTLHVGGYERDIKQRTVSFVCKECGKHVEEMRYPGPVPKYCLSCVDGVRRRQARERKRRQRQSKRV